jgi:hypothetical protein
MHEGEIKMMKRHMPALAMAAALLAAPVAGFAQGSSSDTPRPPGSDPSATVSRQTGMPSSPPGSTGNPTGSSLDRTPTPGASASGNAANPSRPSVSDPAARTATPGRPAPGTATTPGSNTN